MIISISGMDGVGKSTQCKVLNERMPQWFSEPLHIKDSKCFVRKDSKEIADWWFNPKNKNDFVDTMLHALAERRDLALEMAKKENIIVVLDKGFNFYLTRIKATLLSYGTSVEEATRLIEKGLRKYKLNADYEDLQFVIVPSRKFKMKVRPEEQFEETEEIYSRYSKINVSLLNERLSHYNKFSIIKYVKDNPELMNQEILKQIISFKDKDYQMPHGDVVERVTEVAKEVFKDNLKMIILAGSTAKGNHIEGWSDLDFYFVFDKIKSDEIREFHSKTKASPIHIGTTFYELEDLKPPMRVDKRTKVTMYELNIGKDKILYNPWNIKIPYIAFEQLKEEQEENIAENINLIKRQVYSEDMSAKTVIKRLCVLEKIILRTKGIFTETYADTFGIFAKMYKIENIDALKLISKINEPETKEGLRNYGINVLNALQNERKVLNLTK